MGILKTYFGRVNFLMAKQEVVDYTHVENHEPLPQLSQLIDEVKPVAIDLYTMETPQTQVPSADNCKANYRPIFKKTPLMHAIEADGEPIEHKLYRLRHKAKLLRAEVAQRLGTSEKSVYKWSQFANIKPPSRRDIARRTSTICIMVERSKKAAEERKTKILGSNNHAQALINIIKQEMFLSAAARRLEISPDTLRRWVKKEKIEITATSPDVPCQQSVVLKNESDLIRVASNIGYLGNLPGLSDRQKEVLSKLFSEKEITGTELARREQTGRAAISDLKRRGMRNLIFLIEKHGYIYRPETKI